MHTACDMANAAAGYFGCWDCEGTSPVAAGLLMAACGAGISGAVDAVSCPAVNAGSCVSSRCTFAGASNACCKLQSQMVLTFQTISMDGVQ